MVHINYGIKAMKKLSLTKLGEKNNQFTSSTAPSADEFGVGDLWIDGVHYYSNGFSIREAQSTKNNRPRADRASADQYIKFADYSPELASLASSAINPTVEISDDLSGVITAMEGTSNPGGFCGAKIEHPTGFWDFSATHTYPGFSADTVFLLDTEFPPMPNGNDVQFSIKIQIYFVTGAGGTGTSFTNNYRMFELATNSAKGLRQLLAFKFSDMSITGAPNISEVKRIEVRASNILLTNEPTEVTFRGLYVNVKRKGRIVLSFDNSHISWYKEFFEKYLKPKGWGCSQAVVSERVPDEVDGSQLMTLEMLKELQAEGCELINHTTDHSSSYLSAVPTISGTGPWVINYQENSHGRSVGDSVTFIGNSTVMVNGTKTISAIVDTENYEVIETVNTDSATNVVGAVRIVNPLWSDDVITGCSKYFSDNNLIESKVFIYPGGINGPDTWEQLERLGFVAARAVKTGGEPPNSQNAHYGVFNQWDIPTLTLQFDETAASVLAEADDILSLGADCNIYGHQFVETATLPTEFPISEIAPLIEGIQARIDSGLCDVPINCGESVYNY